MALVITSKFNEQITIDTPQGVIRIITQPASTVGRTGIKHIDRYRLVIDAPKQYKINRLRENQPKLDPITL